MGCSISFWAITFSTPAWSGQGSSTVERYVSASSHEPDGGTHEEEVGSNENESVVFDEFGGVKVPAIDALVTLDCRLCFEGEERLGLSVEEEEVSVDAVPSSVLAVRLVVRWDSPGSNGGTRSNPWAERDLGLLDGGGSLAREQGVGGGRFQPSNDPVSPRTRDGVLTGRCIRVERHECVRSLRVGLLRRTNEVSLVGSGETEGLLTSSTNEMVGSPAPSSGVRVLPSCTDWPLGNSRERNADGLKSAGM